MSSGEGALYEGFVGCLIVSLTSMVSVAVFAFYARLVIFVLDLRFISGAILVLCTVVAAGATAAQLIVIGTRALDRQWFGHYAPILSTRRPWFVVMWTVLWTCTAMAFLAWLYVVAV